MRDFGDVLRLGFALRKHGGGEQHGDDRNERQTSLHLNSPDNTFGRRLDCIPKGPVGSIFRGQLTIPTD
jgi:hypothetical protein